MPIGIVTDDDFILELERTNSTSRPSASKKKDIIKDEILTGEVIDKPITSGQVIDKPTRGRDNGDTNVPDSLRQIIGETAVIDGRDEALKLAAAFGISPSSVSAYTNGATSTASYHEPKKSIITHINKSRVRAVKRAGNTLNQALGAITQEKLDYADVKDLSAIAKDMSVIIKNLEPQTSPDEAAKPTPQFVIFAPQFRDERTFESITVQE